LCVDSTQNAQALARTSSCEVICEVLNEWDDVSKEELIVCCSAYYQKIGRVSDINIQHLHCHEAKRGSRASESPRLLSLKVPRYFIQLVFFQLDVVYPNTFICTILL